MEKIQLNAVARETGKKGANASRKAGLVPCVLYANGVAPVYFAIDDLNLKPLIYTNKKVIAHLDFEGQSHDCILKAVDFHPTTDRPIHCDFQALVPGKLIRTSVPVHTVGTPKGVTAGGAMKKVIFKAMVECMPENLPTHIAVDVTSLEIGKDVRIRDLSIEGITFLTDRNQTIARVITKRVR